MVLRNSPHKGTATFAHVLRVAKQAKNPDPQGYREEFIKLVETARALKPDEDRTNIFSYWQK